VNPKFSLKPSGLEASEASSGSNMTQKIIDVASPVGISNEVCKATHTTGLEHAFSMFLLVKGYSIIMEGAAASEGEVRKRPIFSPLLEFSLLLLVLPKTCLREPKTCLCLGQN